MFFFQEMLLNSGRLQDGRKAPANWSLFRIIKSDYSSCETLSMHEMLNEYQALWQTLKDVRDAKTQPVVLFNTMRNILSIISAFPARMKSLKKPWSLWQRNTAMPENMIHFTGPSTATRIRTVEIFSQPASSIRNAI
jgi:hypothetical protein